MADNISEGRRRLLKQSHQLRVHELVPACVQVVVVCEEAALGGRGEVDGERLRSVLRGEAEKLAVRRLQHRPLRKLLPILVSGRDV